MFRLFLFLLALMSCASCSTGHHAGVAHVALQSSAARTLHLTIWFPTEQTDTTEFAGNAVFVGQQAVVDAVPLEGQRPLVLLSHGGFRSARDSGSWLGARLARNGFIAVEINSPNLTSSDAAMREIRLRAEDVGRTLDFLYSEDAWRERISPDHIVSVGFALGGTVALRLAGARLDADQVADACLTDLEFPHPDCEWLETVLENLSIEDRRDLEISVADNRIDGAVAIAPEFFEAIVQPDLRTSPEVKVVQLGALSMATTPIGDRSHFSLPSSAPIDAFPLCRAGARQLLRESGESPEICFSSQFQREFAHDRIFELVARFVISQHSPGMLGDQEP